MDGISGPSFPNLSPQLDSHTNNGQDEQPERVSLTKHDYFSEPQTTRQMPASPTPAPSPEIDTQEPYEAVAAAPVVDTQQFDSNSQLKAEPEAFVEPVSEEVVPPEQVEKVSYLDAQIQEIDITKVVPNPYQPRKVFDQAALEDLAASIQQHGVIQPIVVTETSTGYELVAGERRFRASVLAGLAKVPAIVKKTMGDQTKLEVALIENIQRQELNPIEEAQAYERLIKTFNLTQEQVAKKLGKSRPSVTNTLRLLNLPAEIQRAVIDGRITEGHARALLGVMDRDKQLLMFQQVIEQGWNVRQVEAKVRELSARRQLDAAAPDPKLMAIETELRGKLGTQVKIQRQGRGGKITIDFFSDEELQEIIDRMAESREQQSGGYFTV